MPNNKIIREVPRRAITLLNHYEIVYILLFYASFVQLKTAIVNKITLVYV
jgi:hypothetical protein